MDDLKTRAGEKIGALHVKAVFEFSCNNLYKAVVKSNLNEELVISELTQTPAIIKIDPVDAALGAANNSKDRLNDAVQQSVDAVRKLRAVLMELWQHELVSAARARAWWWAGEAARRVREGAPPLSPAVLYRDLVDLLKDRVWRRTVVIFICGAALGGGAGLLVGLRAGTRAHAGPTARALHTQSDQTVILVEDAVSPGACAGEVLVRVQAFSVCWSDRAVLRGRGAALRALLAAPPVSVGRGFAGVILDVGPGVTDLELGDEVWGVVSEWAGGAASELLAIRRSRVCRRPRALSPTHAAALPWAGARALKALQALGDAAGGGARVLVMGGQSGAACLLVQLLSARGVRVCVAEPPQAHATMKELGAHEVIDLPQSWSLPPGGWDALVVGDGAPGDPPRKLLRVRRVSRTVSLRAGALRTDALPAALWPACYLTFHGYRLLRWVLCLGWHTDWLDEPALPALDLLRDLVEEGQLAPVLDKVYLPHDFEAALAHACGDRALGTTVVRFP